MQAIWVMCVVLLMVIIFGDVPEDATLGEILSYIFSWLREVWSNSGGT